MMMMMMKREREVDGIAMANYLMLLSRGSELQTNNSNSNNHRVFECKTCNRQFSSFQALGGHRASHKKPRLMLEGSSEEELLLLHGSSSSPPKPKTHECSICGLEFAIGQALGGHMRRHRAAAASNATTSTSAAPPSSSLENHNSSISSQNDDVNNKKPTTTNSNSSIKRKRSPSSPSSSPVLLLDLNLTPFENDLEFLKIGQPTSTCCTLVDCFN